MTGGAGAGRWVPAPAPVTTGMSLGDGTRTPPVEADLRQAIAKGPGDTVGVHLAERLS